MCILIKILNIDLKTPILVSAIISIQCFLFHIFLMKTLCIIENTTLRLKKTVANSCLTILLFK